MVKEGKSSRVHNISHSLTANSRQLDLKFRVLHCFGCAQTVEMAGRQQIAINSNHFTEKLIGNQNGIEFDT